ncbi:MAG: PAS domain-containing protein [Comamonadaceae bacterium]|nr:PAS domain-containing protein [Comamonadaceae bacterium]
MFLLLTRRPVRALPCLLRGAESDTPGRSWRASWPRWPASRPSRSPSWRDGTAGVRAAPSQRESCQRRRRPGSWPTIPVRSRPGRPVPARHGGPPEEPALHRRPRSCCPGRPGSLATYPGRRRSSPSTPESTRLGHEAWQGRQTSSWARSCSDPTYRFAVPLDLMVPLSDEGPDAQAARGAAPRMSFDAAAAIDPAARRTGRTRPGLGGSRSPPRVGGENFVPAHPAAALSTARLPPAACPIARFRRPASEDAPGRRKGSSRAGTTAAGDVIEFLCGRPRTTLLARRRQDGPGRADLRDDGRLPDPGGRGGGASIARLRRPALCLLAAEPGRPGTRPSGAKWDEANRTMDELMHQIIGVMPNPAFFKDAEGRYRGTNSAFEKLLGLSKSELIGKTIGDVAPAEIVDTAPGARPGPPGQRRPPGLRGPPPGLGRRAPRHLHQDDLPAARRRRSAASSASSRTSPSACAPRRSSSSCGKFSESTVQTMTEGLVLTDSEGRVHLRQPGRGPDAGLHARARWSTGRSLSVRAQGPARHRPPGGREADQRHLRPLRARLPAQGRHPPHLPGQRRPARPGRRVRRDHGRPDRHHRPQGTWRRRSRPCPCTTS